MFAIRRLGRSRASEPVLAVSGQADHLLREDVQGDGVLTLDGDGYVVAANRAAAALGHLSSSSDLVGRHLTSVYRSAQPAAGDLSRALAIAAVEGTFTESGWQIRADETRFWAEIVAIATLDATDRLAGYTVVVRDLAGHQRRIEQLRAIADVDRRILEGDSSTEVLTLIAMRIRQEVHSDLSVILSPDWDFVLTVCAADGHRAPAAHSALTPGHAAMVGEALRAGHPKTYPVAGWLTDGLGVALCVPLTIRGRTVGAVEVASRSPGRRFGDDDVRAVGMFAGAAALAVDQTRTYEDLQQLSRNLHDSISQTLYGISILARTAQERLERGELRQAREPLDYLGQLADSGLAEVRSVIFERRPESLESENLVDVLTRQAEVLRTRHGIGTLLALGSEPVMTVAAKSALHWIAREALNNVAKHSGAREVRVGLQTVPGAVVLAIVDDGTGFDVRSHFAGHLGLQSMWERARAVGGILDVESRPGEGTWVRATIPDGVTSANE